ncbi:hypothetical protein [Streptomyces sp. NBC_01477]|uniref:hypothetical protein n=1 Tax=Streptomyces sp. NBC_01477 TaxID=2976015 RepID=UPI002E33C98F|nr:hypothetical protein [Streptomyces sp. NBC_01477]
MQETTGTQLAGHGQDVIAVDDLVVDTDGTVVARVMAVGSTKYSLRPPRGGLEWDAPLSRVRPATAREVLAEALRLRGLLPATRPEDAR